MLQEFHLLLPPDREHRKVFSNVLVVGFRKGKSLKDYLVREALCRTNETGRCKPCGKKTCLVCNSVRNTATLTTQACRKTFKIQSGPLNCNLKKVLYILKCEVRGKAPYIGKVKTKFQYRFNNYKSEHIVSGEETEKYPRIFFTIITVWMVI